MSKSSLEAVAEARAKINAILIANGKLKCSPCQLNIQSNFVQKVYVGLEQSPPDYPVRNKILGPKGSFLDHIRIETGATISLRGKGSGFIEPASGRESLEPLHIHITHPKSEGFHAAKALAVNLIETARAEFALWKEAERTILELSPSVVIQAKPVAYQNEGSQLCTYTATEPPSPLKKKKKKLPSTKPVGYASVPAPQQANLTQASVSPTSMVMTVSDTANYQVATKFPVPVPEVKQEAAVAKHRFYNGMEGPKEHTDKEPSPCFQESNVNQPTELPTKGAMKHPAEDRDLMPPSPTTDQTPLTPVNNEEAIPVDRILYDKLSEMSKNKFERRLALLKAYNIYKAEFSSSNEDDESVWEKIAGIVRISCSFDCWTINDCRLQLSQMKEKYEKKDRDWYLVSRSEADILLEEEKFAFETIGYSDRKETKNVPDESPERERKRLRRGIGGLASYIWTR